MKNKNKPKENTLKEESNAKLYNKNQIINKKECRGPPEEIWSNTIRNKAQIMLNKIIT